MTAPEAVPAGAEPERGAGVARDDRSRTDARATSRPLRVARVIARLNVGGPALHAIVATAGLRPDFETTLYTGEVDATETEATAWLNQWDVTPVRVPGLGRAVSPLADLRALRHLVRAFREFRPDIVHTHTAKAGAIGRVAARIARVPVVVHTFHGHVFESYFGRRTSGAIVALERSLARRTDRIVAVSDEVARDLIQRFKVAAPEKVVVIPVGVPLAPLLAIDDTQRAAAREALGLAPGAPVAVLAGRLVPVKLPAMALDAWSWVRAALPDATLLVVGDGPLRDALERRGDAGVRFLGWRDDLARIWAAADVALLTSRNEGTPVALIEAAAAGVPAVATNVGGVPSVVEDGVTGVLVPSGDFARFGAAVLTLLRDSRRRTRMGAAARRRAAARFGHERLLTDLRRLYSSLARPRD